jgi:hypothetical protein
MSEVEVQEAKKKYPAIQMLGVLAIVVAVSLFVGAEAADANWTLTSVIVTLCAGGLLVAWGRIGTWMATR